MAHENPIQIHGDGDLPRPAATKRPDVPPPKNLDLKRDEKLTVTWQDDTTTQYSIAYLRRMSPSADARVTREQLKKNRLTVLTPSQTGDQPLTVEDAELVGNYAIRLRFSDGHDTGIYSWRYLKAIDPANGDVDPEALLGL